VTLEVVPHHGLIIPESRTDTEAISIRWTGNEPTNEARAFLRMAYAANVDDVRDAYEHFGVGGQNLVAITRDGDVYWSTQCVLPVREAGARTWDPVSNPAGTAPLFVLPGDGTAEWMGTLSDRFLPHDLNPTRGFIATANGDNVGVTADGNPLNDDHYVGFSFDAGHRIARITRRLTELTTAGGVTPEDMSALQADARSPLGAGLAAALVAELDRAEAEMASPGTHADLAAAVAAAGTRLPWIFEMRDRLEAWTSFETPAAVEGAPSATEIADSVATSIFNAALYHLLALAFDDEGTVLGRGLWTDRVVWTALRAPETMVSHDATLGDTVLWDDLTTDEVESRGERVLRAFAAAYETLRARLGDDIADWRWGRLHTLRLRSIVPALGVDVLSIPPDGDPLEDGVPRHGDNHVVDASFTGYDVEDFTYGSGPVQRLVVEMTPDGPRAWNALPGGQSQDPSSPHHADEFLHWRRNDAPPLYFVETDVVAHAERRLVFTGR
jgi:penicillin amidase